MARYNCIQKVEGVKQITLKKKNKLLKQKLEK